MAIPPSPTSPSPTQASHAIYREADHAPTRAYRLLSSLICQLGSHKHRAFSFIFLNLFFPANALNPPLSPPPYPRRRVFFAGIAVSTSGLHSPSSSKHHPRSIIICPRQTTGPSYLPSTPSTYTTPATRNSTATPTQVPLNQHHCERCYDYDPVRCHSTVVIALFAHVIVSHYNPTVTSNRRPTLARYLSVARSLGMK